MIFGKTNAMMSGEYLESGAEEECIRVYPIHVVPL